MVARWTSVMRLWLLFLNSSCSRSTSFRSLSISRLSESHSRLYSASNFFRSDSSALYNLSKKIDHGISLKISHQLFYHSCSKLYLYPLLILHSQHICFYWKQAVIYFSIHNCLPFCLKANLFYCTNHLKFPLQWEKLKMHAKYMQKSFQSCFETERRIFYLW